jgi:hypothetical protein
MKLQGEPGVLDVKEATMKYVLMNSAFLALCLTGVATAGTEEDADDFMQIHKIEIGRCDDHIRGKDLQRKGSDQSLLASRRAISAAEALRSLHAGFPNQIFC